MARTGATGGQSDRTDLSASPSRPGDEAKAAWVVAAIPNTDTIERGLWAATRL